MVELTGQLHFGPTESVRCNNWSRGPFVIIGDAAHAVSPVTGQGGAMALEDAVVLAEECPPGGDVPVALSEFEARRRPRTDGLHELMQRAVGAVTGRSGVGAIEFPKIAAEVVPLLAPAP